MQEPDKIKEQLNRTTSKQKRDRLVTQSIKLDPGHGSIDEEHIKVDRHANKQEEEVIKAKFDSDCSRTVHEARGSGGVHGGGGRRGGRGMVMQAVVLAAHPKGDVHLHLLLLLLMLPDDLLLLALAACCTHHLQRPHTHTRRRR